MLAAIYFDIDSPSAVHKFLYYTDILIFVISPYLILLEKIHILFKSTIRLIFIFYFHGHSLFLCPYYCILETASFQFCYRLSVNVFSPTSCLSLLMHTFLKSIFLVLSFPSNSWSLSTKLPSTITFSAYEIQVMKNVARIWSSILKFSVFRKVLKAKSIFPFYTLTIYFKTK